MEAGSGTHGRLEFDHDDYDYGYDGADDIGQEDEGSMDEQSDNEQQVRPCV